MLDTVTTPEELKPYLSLYLEVLFESPVERDGGMDDLHSARLYVRLENGISLRP